MKTQEILAVIVLIAVVGWVGFMATNANAAYSPSNAINAATNAGTQTNGQSNVQSGTQQATAPSVIAGNNQPSGQQNAATGAQSNALGGAGQTITIPIKVAGGYYDPRQITIQQGTHVLLDLDPNTLVGCMVNFNIWGMNGQNIKKVVTAQDHILEFTADTPGVYKTSCNMGMGDGRIIVVAAGQANAAGAQVAAASGSSAELAAPSADSNGLAAPTNPSAAPSGGACGSGGGCGCGCGGSK